MRPFTPKQNWGNPPDGMTKTQGVEFYRPLHVNHPAELAVQYAYAHALWDLSDVLRSMLLDLHIELNELKLAVLLLQYIRDVNPGNTCDYHECVPLYWSSALIALKLGGPKSPRARECLRRAVEQFPVVLQHLLLEPLEVGENLDMFSMTMTRGGMVSNAHEKRSKK
jgi:hypothetical protein